MKTGGYFRAGWADPDFGPLSFPAAPRRIDPDVASAAPAPRLAGPPESPRATLAGPA